MQTKTIKDTPNPWEEWRNRPLQKLASFCIPPHYFLSDVDGRLSSNYQTKMLQNGSTKSPWNDAAITWNRDSSRNSKTNPLLPDLQLQPFKIRKAEACLCLANGTETALKENDTQTKVTIGVVAEEENCNSKNMGIDEKQNIDLKHNNLHDGVSDFESRLTKFRDRKLPIICVLGHPDIQFVHTRRLICTSISEVLRFKYIQIDDIIFEWGKISTAEKSTLLPYMRKTIEKSKSLYENQFSVLHDDDIMEMFKIIFADSGETEGFIVDYFPCNINEYRKFEETFYPPLAGLYFLNEKWSSDKKVPLTVFEPEYFRKGLRYSEKLVEETAGSLGRKCIQVLNTDFISQKEVQFILFLLLHYIKSYPDLPESEFFKPFTRKIPEVSDDSPSLPATTKTKVSIDKTKTRDK